VERPETRYLDVGGIAIAYQEFGEGAETLLVVGAQLNHIEMMWEVPVMARHMRQLGTFASIVFFDRRGIGQSDRTAQDVPSTIEEHVDDIAAIVEAMGDKPVKLFANAEGCAPAMVFAAENPHKVMQLVLYAASARLSYADEYPIGIPAHYLQADFGTWGDAEAPLAVEIITPSMADDPEWRSTLARMQRLSGSPSAAARFFNLTTTFDVRSKVPLVRCPVLLLHVTGDRLVPVSHGRWLRDRIPNARLLEIEGTDHFYFHENADAVAAAIEEFVVGTSRSGTYGQELTTILFVDIVDSTPTATRLGSRAWREKLDLLNQSLSTEVGRHAGRMVKDLGDGLLACFSLPSAAIQFADDAHLIAERHELQLRVGLHIGEVERRGADVIGPAVNVAARIQGVALPTQTLASQAVRDSLHGSRIGFAPAEHHRLKGFDETWPLYQPMKQPYLGPNTP
jgi:class 3 adenylate cyclase